MKFQRKKLRKRKPRKRKKLMGVSNQQKINPKNRKFLKEVTLMFCSLAK
jgi:hypothetical protein